MKTIISLIIALAMFLGACFAQDEPALDSLELPAELVAMIDSMHALDSTFNYMTGEITLDGGIATVNVPEGFTYLNGEESERVLTEIWGNPPGGSTLGMLFPEGSTPAFSTWAIDIYFEEMGYVEDDDAGEIDYTELLEQLQEETREASDARAAQGYERVALIGWAAEPYYDAVNKKLHWAKELKFGEDEDHSLNYNIRILGRKGVLVLNAIGDMGDLEDINSQLENVLNSVNFEEGNRYADFDPSIDEIAAVGIGGLIAGKVLAKAGFLAILAKFGKFIFVGLAVAGGAVWRFITGRKKEEEEA